jgi:voltage-gated potassium channel
VSVFDPHCPPSSGWRVRAYEVIFEADTRAGMIFDFSLLLAILLSVVVISLETVEAIAESHRGGLRVVEWVLTGLFTIEYVMRVIVVGDRRRYMTSFMGMVDLLALLPTYASLFIADAQALQVIRALRLLRVFRLLELGPFLQEGNTLLRAFTASRYKIGVFLGTILIIVVIQGALIYFVEHQVNDGFSSIPRSIYWAVVTLTTVGYGDISPITVPGQALATLLMLLGYGVIAVPTGIVTAQLTQEARAREQAREPLIHPHSTRPDQCAAPLPGEAVIDGVELGASKDVISA